MAAEPIDLNDIAAVRRHLAELEAGQAASLTGSGAVAQGGGEALGERSVKVEGDAETIVTGIQIVTHYHAAADGRLTKEQIAR